MRVDTETLDRVIALLNRLAQLDPLAMFDLFQFRIECNRAFDIEPSLPILGNGHDNTVGFLGVLNYLFGADRQQRGLITIVRPMGTNQRPFVEFHRSSGINVTDS